MRRLSFAFSSLALAVVLAPGAHAQPAPSVPALPPLPSGAPYEFVFDDFTYNRPVDYVGTEGALRGGSPGSLFGRNPWFQGCPTCALAATPTRAWFAGALPEDTGWFSGYDGPGGDRSWFDPAGYHITTTDAPGRLVLRTERGTYRERSYSFPSVASGFASSKGTWVARVQLPRWDGLVHHPPIGGRVANLSMIPSFWTQSSDFVRETRPAFKSAEGYVWSEVNVEFNNWADTTGRCDGDAPGCALSLGVTWAKLHSALGRNPVLGGPDRGCRIDGRRRGWDACLGAVMLQRYGPRYAYVLIRSVAPTTATSARLDIEIRMRDETDDGAPADLHPGFESLTMALEGGLNSHAPPSAMKMLFSVILAVNGNDAARDDETETLPERKDFVVDWAFFTPRTDKALLDIAADVGAVRGHLGRHYNDAHPAAPILRVNTVRIGAAPGRPLPLDGDLTSEPDACTGGRLIRARRPVDFALVASADEGETYLRPQFKQDETFGLRHANARVTFDAYAIDAGGRRVRVETVSDQGAVYRLPRESARWRTAARREVEVTVELLDLSTPPSPCSAVGPAVITHTYRVPG